MIQNNQDLELILDVFIGSLDDIQTEALARTLSAFFVKVLETNIRYDSLQCAVEMALDETYAATNTSDEDE